MYQHSRTNSSCDIQQEHLCHWLQYQSARWTSIKWHGACLIQFGIETCFEIYETLCDVLFKYCSSCTNLLSSEKRMRVQTLSWVDIHMTFEAPHNKIFVNLRSCTLQLEQTELTPWSGLQTSSLSLLGPFVRNCEWKETGPRSKEIS